MNILLHGVYLRNAWRAVRMSVLAALEARLDVLIMGSDRFLGPKRTNDQTENKTLLDRSKRITGYEDISDHQQVLKSAKSTLFEGNGRAYFIGRNYDRLVQKFEEANPGSVICGTIIMILKDLSGITERRYVSNDFQEFVNMVIKTIKERRHSDVTSNDDSTGIEKDGPQKKMSKLNNTPPRRLQNY